MNFIIGLGIEGKSDLKLIFEGKVRFLYFVDFLRFYGYIYFQQDNISILNVDKKVLIPLGNGTYRDSSSSTEASRQ